uniref:Uncharacterized protein n=1 Tax=Brassica oleracea TaxID=3712 RepID=A0A3P6F4E0_BRAOL|nr:unnamed protein product [Brassica oleracea]
MVEIAPPTFVLGSTTLEIHKEQDSDHDQGENQKLSLYQALSLKTLLADYLLLIAYEVAKAKEDNDEKHKPSARYHNASQQELRVVIPRPELLPGLHVQRTYDYSQKGFFLSVLSHAQLTLASHCVRNSSVLTMQPLSAMCDWQVWAYLQICSLHELFFFFPKLLPSGFFSH